MENKTYILIGFPNEVLARMYRSMRNDESLEKRIIILCQDWIMRKEQEQLKKEKRKRA